MANPLYDALLAPLKDRAAAFLILPDGTEISGDVFHGLASRQAAVLAHAGVAPGDRVLVQVSKSPDTLALYAACVMRGAVFVPLNPAYVADEVRYFLRDARPALFVCDPARQGELAAEAAAIGAAVLTLGADGSGTLLDAPGQEVHVATRADGDLAAILYTSGTTGRSKGAMLTQGNLLSNAVALADLWRFGAGDVLLHALPIFHTHGLFVATNVTLLARASMVFLPAFDPAEVLRLLASASVMMGVPTFYTRLLAHPCFTADAARGVRLFISGSAPLLAETHLAFEERTGQRILERYGMTETNMITSNPCDGERRAGTVGQPLPGVEVRIVAAPGADGTGEIEVRGPNVFAGYWGMPDKTAEDMRADGFFRSGDLGRWDAAGYLEIVGRAKDLVISGGFNVYPREVEAALDDLPGVTEAAVIGVPHPDLGEAVFAVLVADAGTTADAAIAALSGRLARFKQPRAGVVVAELPRNAMGKVQKAALRAAYAGWFDAPGREAP